MEPTKTAEEIVELLKDQVDAKGVLQGLSEAYTAATDLIALLIDVVGEDDLAERGGPELALAGMHWAMLDMSYKRQVERAIRVSMEMGVTTEDMEAFVEEVDAQ